jgi:hypothetical protein
MNSNVKGSFMNSNVKGMLFTAGAIVVGILAASFIQAKVMPKVMPKASVDEGDE